MMKRAQSAMEFLMTYGWAILIMLVVIAILFMLGVFNPKSSIPESCVLPAGFSCYSYRLDDTGKLFLDLGQARGRNIIVTGVSCSAEPGAEAQNLPTQVLMENGRHKVIADGIQCYDADGNAVTYGENYRGKIIIAYRESGSSITRTASGDISAKLEGGSSEGTPPPSGTATPTPGGSETPTPTPGGSETPTPTPGGEIVINSCPYTISEQGEYTIGDGLSAPDHETCILILPSASGSTLDCHGATIDGGSPTSGPPDYGVYLDAGTDSITINDCLFRGFWIAVGEDPSATNLVVQWSTFNEENTIAVDVKQYSEVTHNNVEGNGGAFSIAGTGSYVAYNYFNCPPGSGGALLVQNSATSNTVEYNTFVNCGVSLQANPDYPATDNIIQYNGVSGSYQYALYVSGSSNNQLLYNTASPGGSMADLVIVGNSGNNVFEGNEVASFDCLTQDSNIDNGNTCTSSNCDWLCSCPSNTCSGPTPTTIATGLNGVGDIIIDGSYAYFSEWNDGNSHIHRVPTDGGTVEDIVTSGLSGVNSPRIYNGYIYFADDYNAAIKKVELSGGTVTTLASGYGSAHPRGLAVYGDSIYWTGGGGGWATNVYSVSTSGGTVTIISAGGCCGGYGLDTDGTYAYWGDAAGDGSDNIYRVPLTGGETVSLFGSANYPGRVVVDGGYVYWVEHYGGVVRKVPTEGGSTTTLADGLGTPYVLATDGSFVYFTDYSAGTVNKVPVGGGAVTQIFTGATNPAAIAVSGGYVYWSESTGEIKKLQVD